MAAPLAAGLQFILLAVFLLDERPESRHSHAMRLTLAVVASLLVILGMWLIASGFIPTDAPSATAGAQLTARPHPTLGPVAMGSALLAGGGLFFILLLRRR
jgi:uncharacterized membrane-anchored protein